jgi:hypothetical protein
MVRDHVLKVRLNDREHQKLQRLADEEGAGLAEKVRLMIRDSKIKEEPRGN